MATTLQRVVCSVLLTVFTVQPLAHIFAHSDTYETVEATQPAATSTEPATQQDFSFDMFDMDEDEEEAMTRWEKFKDVMGTIQMALGMFAKQKSRAFSQWWYNGGREKALLAALMASAAGSGFGTGYYMGKKRPIQKKKPLHLADAAESQQAPGQKTTRTTTDA